ncbi:MAG: TPM domain-containing protein [Alcanivorax sp.]|nr:TPM domain-containing protein [Alcanivorax sp.]
MLLNEETRKQVADAIAAQEKRTDAELVTVLARRADDYRYVTLLWASLLSLLVPLVLAFTPLWLAAADVLLAQWGTLIVLALLFRLGPLQRRLVPRHLQLWRATGLARRAFIEQGLHHTRGATGLLIFVSEAEHYVEILADEGIARHVANSEWQHIVDDFTARVKAGQVAEGFLACIQACGDKLAEHVPASTQKNELPNHLVML